MTQREVAETLDNIPEGELQVWIARESPPSQGTLPFDLSGMSTTNWRILYQDSQSNKASRGETNKSTKEILEMPQDTCPYNC